MNELIPETVGTTEVGGAGPVRYRPLRAWPALVLVVLMVGARIGPAYMEGGLAQNWMIAVFGPTICCLLLVIWWLAASRATWRERVFGFLGLIGGVAVTAALVHPTMRGAGTNYLTVPMGMVLFGLGAFFLAGQRPLIRTGTAVLLAFVGFSYSQLLRNEGMTGEYAFEMHWRWSPSREEQFVRARWFESGRGRNGRDSKGGGNHGCSARECGVAGVSRDG